MASIIIRIVILALGYMYPAYECFKAIEVGKPDIEQLQYWCQYWIIMAILTVSERFADAVVSWLPFYNEAKLAFIIYLWHPKTKGTAYVYATFIKPFVSEHQLDIDQNMVLLRMRALEMSDAYWKKALVCAQIKFFEVLQYISSQSHDATNQPGLVALQRFSSPVDSGHWVQVSPGFQILPQQTRQVPPSYQSPLPQLTNRLQTSASESAAELLPAQPLAPVDPSEQKNKEGEETDFEWLDADELPAPGMANKAGSTTIMQTEGIRFRGWWRRFSSPQ